MHDVSLDRVLGRLVTAPDNLTPDEAAALRRPPQSTEAEQSVLGALMLDASGFAKVAEVIGTSDFFRHEHRLIWDAINSLVQAQAPIDPISVFERLEREGTVKEAGGLVYLNSLTQGVPSTAPATLARYAQIVRDRASNRALIALADEISSRAFKNEPAVELFDEAKTAIANLATARAAGARGRRVPVLSLPELREHSHSAAWLVKGIVPADTVGMIFGASQTFKSFIALDAALHVARGLPWIGKRTTQGPVVYLAAEGGAGIWKRVVAWHRARRLQWSETPMHVVPVALDLQQDAQIVVDSVTEKGIERPVLVVVDTLSQTYSGEENSANEVAAYLRGLGARFRDLWHCTVMVIHHSGHSATERPRGSTAMVSNVDWLFGVHRDEKEMLATLSCAKQKDEERFSDIPFSLTSTELGKDEDGDVVRSLVARHISNPVELREAIEAEGKAGRGGTRNLILSLLNDFNGSRENEMRDTYMKECGKDTPEGRRQSWKRDRDWAVREGFMDVAQGYVIRLGKSP